MDTLCMSDSTVICTHRTTCIHCLCIPFAWIMVYGIATWIFLDSRYIAHCLYYMDYCYMSSPSCNPVTWLFPVTDIDIPVTGHECCWYIVSCYWYGYPRYWTWELLICDMWTPTSIVPVSRYIVPVSRYIVLCYQQSSGPVIMLPVSCTVVVLVTLYTWRIRS